MPTRISPGVSVSVSNEAFFSPAIATTVPLFFIATRANKMQADQVTPASGTTQHSVVRTVTSLAQSMELFGPPVFHRSNAGSEHHGDARNEYGLLALNNFLASGNRAYVVRANIDLNDEARTFISLGTPIATEPTFTGVGNGTIAGIVATSPQIQPQTITVTFTSPTAFSVIGTVAGHITAGIVGEPITSSVLGFTVTEGAVPFVAGDKFTFNLRYTATARGTNVGNGTLTNLRADTLATPESITIRFTSPTAFTVSNAFGPAGVGVVNSPFDDNRINFMITQGSVPFVAGDEFIIDAIEVRISNPLGATDAQRRISIATALQAAISSNTDVRSELYQYNLILCPGYPEAVDELVTLSSDIKEEAFVLADTPCNLSPEQVAQWALTSDRQSKTSVAYYYPWALQTNIDGRTVLGAPSGVALRTIAYSDDQSFVWMGPAGVSRGLTFNVLKTGYVSGDLGGPTTFVEAALNEAQRDNLYEYDKNINPITFFPGRGILIWGQKTSAPTASALDRINVVRLVMYLRRVLRKGAMPFVFEPNDQFTRNNLKAAADSILHDVMTKRGLTDFATYCNAANNTPDRIDRNELYLDVAIKPTRSAEFIFIPIRVVSSAATI